MTNFISVSKTIKNIIKTICSTQLWIVWYFVCVYYAFKHYGLLSGISNIIAPVSFPIVILNKLLLLIGIKL